MDRVLSLPVSITLGVTNLCNLQCKHCFASARKAYSDEMDTVEMLALIDRLSDLKIFCVTVSGGEPLARKDIFSILRKLVASKIRISINTNGTLITEKTADLLADLPVHDGMTIGFDGANAQSHDALRGPGSFDRVVRGMEYLARKRLKYKCFTVVNQYNCHELDAIAERVLELGARSVDFNCLVPGGRGSYFSSKLELSPPERKKACNDILYLSEKYPGFISGYYLGWAKRIREFETNRPDHEAKSNHIGFCGAATNTCSIRADGWVVPCHSLWDVKAGNIRTEPLEQIWQRSNVFQQMRAACRVSLDDVEGCKSCNLRTVCRGGCRAGGYYAKGHFEARDPFCWFAKETL